MSNSHRLFLITGVASGFGRAFAEAALAAGHTVVGTVRTEAARIAFERLHESHAHGVILDVTELSAVAPTVDKVVERYGPIDVLVNNAGYGHEGTMEESSLDDLLKQFQVNVFGAVAMMKAVLPGMRNRRAGHIFNITSMAGHVGLPGITYYAGSKFALEGISQALAAEVRGFGIKVTAVAPGSFRTDWAGRSMVRTERSIDDYDAVFTQIRENRLAKNGKQAGDPAKAAAVLLSLVENEDPPTSLLLGNDAFDLVTNRLASLDAAFHDWEAISRSTDFS
ncbi:oxidoreductase (plasmid) [Cupriavidus sp. KK10]|uniref:oxidoreductase n=1 Tax=Cupriavidus sp. KK10 TaxID=1478019 RepID=UPI001BA6A1D4|nr:oxidoreductase [Cupriavidus sp. KK10]QUN32419.1 oxidoreductase [Cupriavidus sp. KK10]